MGRSKGRGRVEPYKKEGKTHYRLHWRDARGQRRKRNAGSNKTHAEKLLNQIISDRDKVEEGLGGLVGMERKLGELATEYLAWMGRTRTKRHYKRIEGALQGVLASIKAGRVRELQITELQQYQNRRSRDGAANRTINIETGALGAMLNWAVDSGLISENPVKALRPMAYDATKVVRKRRPLEEAEVSRLLEVARARDEELGRPVPFSLLWEALLTCGARVGELTATAWGDLDVEARTITLRTTKNKIPRTVPWMDPGIVERLLELKAKRARIIGRLPLASDLIFLSPRGQLIQVNNTRREFQKVLKGAGIASPDSLGRTVDLYSLRHTFGSWLAAKGVPLADLSKMMGHRDPKITMNYYVTPDVEAQKQRLDELGVRDSYRHLFGT